VKQKTPPHSQPSKKRASTAGKRRKRKAETLQSPGKAVASSCVTILASVATERVDGHPDGKV